jgi:hypothetical protein
MRPCSLRYGLRLSGIRCLNVIGYLSGELYDLARSRREKFYMHFIMLGFTPDSISCISVLTYFMFTLQGTRPVSCRWVRYAPESCLTWPSLHRHRPLGVLAAARLTPRLGGWRCRPCGVSPLTRPVPTLLGVPSMARLAPMLGGWARQGTRRTFGVSSSSCARGLGAGRSRALSVLSVARLLPYSGLGAGNNSVYTMRKLKRFSHYKICFERSFRIPLGKLFV